MEDTPFIRLAEPSSQRAAGCRRRTRPYGFIRYRQVGHRLPRSPASRSLRLAVLAGALLFSQAGCSLFVMAGKVFFGDPKVTCSFRQATQFDLVKSNRKTLILCSTPDSIKSQSPSLDFDLLNAIARQLKVRGVNVVNPDSVTGWLDDHGGRWDDLAELGEHFDADVIIHIDLDRFSYHEENSPTLLRGRVDGRVQAYEIVKVPDGPTTAASIFDQEFVSVYPDHHPVSSQRTSAKTFQHEYLSRLTNQLAQMFYDHPMSEEIH